MSRSTPKVPKALRIWVESLGERCEYCQTSEWIAGIALEIDHIIPRAKSGTNVQTNVCRACSTCNTNKGDKTEAIDPDTGIVAQLFNPRLQRWQEHFAWSEDGRLIIGLTPCGRATIDVLAMNNPRIVRSRDLWSSVGWHPPKIV